MDKFGEHFGDIDIKHLNFEKELGQVSSQVSSILKFTCQWEDLQNELKQAKECLLVVAGELTLQQRTLEDKEKTLNQWSKELESRSVWVEGKINEAEAREREKDSLERRIGECRSELKSLEKDSRGLRNKEDELSSLISNYNCQLARKEEELNKIDKLLECRNSWIELKEKKLKTLQDLVETCSVQVDIKSKELSGVEISLNQCLENLDSAKKKSEETENLIQQRLEELNLKEEKLQAVKELIEKNSEELASKLNCLDQMNELIQENTCRLQEQEKRYNSAEEAISTLSTRRILDEIELSTVQCSIEEIFRDLRLKVDHLDLITIQIQDKAQQLQVMDNQSVEMQISLDTISTMTRTSVVQHEEEVIKGKLKLKQVQKLVHERSEELRKLMERDVSTRKSFERLCAEVEAKEKELNRMNNLLKEYCNKAECQQTEIKTAENKFKELEEREKQCDSLDIILKRCSEELHVKEMEFELKAKQKNDVHNSFQEILKEVESGLRLSIHLDECKALQQHEASETLDLRQDPAGVVFPFLNHQGFRASKLINRVLILDRLVEVSPLINPELKNASSSLADNWLNFCEDIKDPGEVLALFLFMIAYGLVSNSNCNAILSLIGTVSQHNQAPALCQSLGFTHQIPGFIKTLIRRKEHPKVAATLRSVYDLLPELAWQKYLDEAREACIRPRGEDSKEAQDGVVDNDIVTMRAVLNFMAEHIKEICSVPEEDLTAHVHVAKRKNETSLNPVPEIENQPRKTRRMTAKSVR